MRRAPVGRLLLVLALLAAACGPSGPGPLTGRVTGTDLGAVVLEVEGTGIQSFEALGSTRVYAGPVPGLANTHRVILVSPEAGRLDFRLNVDDRDMEGPVITVIEAASASNEALPVSSPTIAVER